MSATDDIVAFWPTLKADISAVCDRWKASLAALAAAHDTGDTDAARAVIADMQAQHAALSAAVSNAPPAA